MDSIDVYMNKSEGDSTINEPLNEEEVTSEKAKQVNDQLIKIGGIIEEVSALFNITRELSLSSNKSTSTLPCS